MTPYGRDRVGMPPRPGTRWTCSAAWFDRPIPVQEPLPREEGGLTRMAANFRERLPRIEHVAGTRAHRPVDQVQLHPARRLRGCGPPAARMTLMIRTVRPAEAAQASIAVLVPHTTPARAAGLGPLPAEGPLRDDASRALTSRLRAAEPLHAPSPALPTGPVFAPSYFPRTAEPADSVSRAFSTAAGRRPRRPGHHGARRPSSFAVVLVRGPRLPVYAGPRGAFAARSRKPPAMAAPS